MKYLINKQIRDILRMKGQFIAIAMVIFVGAFFYTGFSNFARNLDDYANNYFSESHLADLWLYYGEVSQDEIEKISAINGILEIEGRRVFDLQALTGSAKTVLKAHTLPENINLPTLLAGELPTAPAAVAIDADYASANQIRIGDTLPAVYAGQTYYLTVSGYCESAEYTIKSRNSADYPPNHEEYGIAYLSGETVGELFSLSGFNEVILTGNGTVSLSDIEHAVDDMEKADSTSYLYSLRRTANLSYKQFTEEVAQQKEFAKILPGIFFGVAALITYLTMSRLVDVQRTQIGVMKALGVTRSRIILHYLGFALAAGSGGGLTGSIAGSYIFPRLFLEQFSAIITLPGFTVRFHAQYILQSLILAVIFGMLACYLSVRKILKENAAGAMRPKPPKNAAKTSVERITRLWNRFSYPDRLIVRNILLNKKRAAFSAAAIMCCVALLILAFGYKGSRSELINRQYTKVYDYDVRVIFDEPIENQPLPALEGIDYRSEIAQTNVIITNLPDRRNLNLIAAFGENRAINNYTPAGELLTPDHSSVIISQRFAEVYDLSPGDMLNIKLISPEYRGLSFDVPVGGISVQYLNQDIYCTSGLLENHGIRLLPDTFLFKTRSAAAAKNLCHIFGTMDSVKEVKTKNDVRAATEGGLKNLFAMIIIIIVCAVLLSAAAIYNISVINIQERFRELATLKVLGCRQKMIDLLIFEENILITVFAIAAGIPAGIAAYTYVLKTFTLDSMVFPVYITADSILWPVAITLLVTLLCNLILRKKTEQIDMVESLKAVE